MAGPKYINSMMKKALTGVTSAVLIVRQRVFRKKIRLYQGDLCPEARYMQGCKSGTRDLGRTEKSLENASLAKLRDEMYNYCRQDPVPL